MQEGPQLTPNPGLIMTPQLTLLTQMVDTQHPAVITSFSFVAQQSKLFKAIHSFILATNIYCGLVCMRVVLNFRDLTVKAKSSPPRLHSDGDRDNYKYMKYI